MREIDPFAFFERHASAIKGLGGDGRSPDPRYCFHTPYVEVRPGLASFELTLTGAFATHGELALRVHAFRPESGENASLAAAGRLNVLSDEKQDLNVKVRFNALHDVKYAFYGHFLEDGDISAEHVTVTLLEPEGEAENYVEPPRSALALQEEKREVRPANALIHAGPARLNAPVSQDCTWAQLAELGLAAADPGSLVTWSEAHCLAAMVAYSIGGSGLEGRIVGHVTPSFWQNLSKSGFILRYISDAAQARSPGTFADFILCPAGLPHSADPLERWATVKACLAGLKIGGLAVVHMRYRHDPAPLHAASAVDGADLARNEIGKWVLRLIGEGYSVAPIAFSPEAGIATDDHGLAAFNLIVRRW